MERKLKALFDLQKFDGNRDLQQVIDSVHAKYAVRELSLDDIEYVAAAGVPELQNKRKNGEK